MDFLKSRVYCIVYLDWLLSNIVSYKAMLSLPRLTQLAPHRWVGAGHYLNCRLSAKWDKDHHFSPALTLSSLCWVLQTLKNALCVGEHLIDLLFFQAKKSLMQHIHTTYIIGKTTCQLVLLKLSCVSEGQTNLKWFFQANLSSKKRTKKFDFTTCRLVFRSFFGRRWRPQKYISKLTDL